MLTNRPKTKILVDGRDPTETTKIKQLLGYVDGQTTNPSLIAKNPDIRKRIAAGHPLSQQEEQDAYREPEDRKELNLSVEIPAEGVILKGDLHIPDDPVGAVLFAHGSGSSRHSPRNQFVAQVLQTAGMATLLLDLLTKTEERIDQQSGRLRFDVNLLAGRLVVATAWLSKAPELHGVKTGIFGASTGAAAALIAAAKTPQISTVVSRGGAAGSSRHRSRKRDDSGSADCGR